MDMPASPSQGVPTGRFSPVVEMFRAISDSVKQRLSAIFLILASFLFVLVYFAPDIFVTIQSGYVGVRYLRFFGGTQTEFVLGEGFKFVFPWDKLFVYDTRVQEIKHDLTVLTGEGLAIGVHISIRYRPEAAFVGLLHQRIGQDYPARIVIPEVESGLRGVLGKVKLRNLYDLEANGTYALVRNEIGDSLATQFITLDGIMVRGIDLPAPLMGAIEGKMVQGELAESYGFRLAREKQEAERKLIEAGGLRAYNRILDASITPNLLKWRAIDASKELALSPNAKTIVLGSGQGASPPFFLGGEK